MHDIKHALTVQEIHFLYLIATGNNDSVYKVGISVDPNARLKQIKATYRVPNAYIVETMDVQTRDEVFALESALHARFESRRVTLYGGREFFKLSTADLEWLKNLYKDNSNDFAQAKAYYGLELAAVELRGKAMKFEQERQRKIDYNRRNGKTHNTKPTGDLKRYNSLQDKLKKGHLGERFTVRSHSHPSLALSARIQSKVNEIVAEKTGLNFFKVCAIGFFSGAIVGIAKGSSEIIGTAFSGGAIGLISGSLSQAIRGNGERRRAKVLIDAEIDKRYPGMRNQTMLALADLKTNNSFIIRDYGESGSNLRNRQAVQPVVDLPSKEKIFTAFQGKSYFPKVATAITVGLCLGIGVGSGGSISQPVASDHLETATQTNESSRNQSSNQSSIPLGTESIEPQIPSADTATSTGEVSDPDLIHDEFRADNSAALSKYNNSYYKITGIVDDTEEGYIKVDSRTLLGGAAYCYYKDSSERDKSLHFARNQALTVSGRLELEPRSKKRLRLNVLDCSIHG